MTENSKQPRKRNRKNDIVRAAKSGDRLETLIALRDLLAERLQTSKSDRDIASMSRRLMQCIDRIEELQNETGKIEKHGDEIDEKTDQNAPTRLQDLRTRAAGNYWPKKA